VDIVQIIFIGITIILATLSIVSGGFLVVRSFLRHRASVNVALHEDLEIIRVAHAQDHKNDTAQNPEAWKEEIGAMEQLLVSLSRLQETRFGWKQLLYGKPTITLEIANPSGVEEIFFYIAVPQKYRNALEKQVHSYFPNAQVEKVEDYTIFAPGSEVVMANMKLKESHALPLTTYEEMEVDPLSEITTALSKLETAYEGACVQVVLQSPPSTWRVKGRKIAHEMQQGKRLREVYKKSIFINIIHTFFDALTASKPSEDTQQTQLTPEEQELIKMIENKIAKIGFATNIRLLSSAKTKERAEEILSHMENAFTQFEKQDVNSFVVRHFTKKAKTVAFHYIFRTFNEDYSMVLGVEEIASIFHFPISTTETPKITWLKSGSAPPPINIPQEGILLGYNDYRGVQTEIRLTDADRRRHLYVIGQTGVGKSTFLQEIAKQDVRNGKGMCFIDPHGDAIEDIMSAIPRERAEDVIYFDPSDTERPFGLNMMEYDKPEEKTFVVNELINIFDKLYDLKATGGPMFEQYMRNAMLLIMEDPETGSTLMEIPKVLADEEFRKMKLSKCKNPVVKDFWTKEAEKAGGEAALANMVPYITSKLTPFLSNDMMRPIISQQKSTIDFRDAMDSGKILLINLSKGKIGEMNSYLLGMIIVGKLLMAALSRVDMPERERKDFYLYIDEFQNVTTDSIAQILSEARKYRLALVIAHQFIGQLSEEISKAVFGNVGSLAAFRVGPEDADFLEKQFEPVFTAHDLVNVDNYNFFARLLINNQTVPPFNMKSYPPTDGSREIVDKLKELSRLKYGRDRAIVEAEVQERSRMAPTEGATQKPEGEHYWR